MDEENLLVEAAKELVWNARKPPGWTTRQNRGRPRRRGRGRPEVFHWRAAAVVLLLQAYLGLDYRGMAAHLRARPELLRRLELERAPKKSTIHRAHGRLSEAWLRERNDEVTAAFQKRGDRRGGPSPWTARAWRPGGGSGGGSSASSTLPRSAGSPRSRSTWERTAAWRGTWGTCAGTRRTRPGRTPGTWRTAAGGCPAWRRTVLSRRRHPRAFERRHHRRSNGEAVNSSFKRRLGSDLRSRTWWNQRREAALKVIVHNLRFLLQFRVRHGGG